MTDRPSLILDTVVDAVSRTAVVLSVFLLMAGHNAPGGGFVGGLVAAIALVLRHLAGAGPRENGLMRLGPGMVLGAGLLLATLTGMAGWLWGEAFLTSASLAVDVPLLGTVKATSALPFDVGVYLVVVGFGLVLLRTLGREELS